MSYPNQKKIKIHKHKYEKNFLQIGNDEWQEVFKKVEPSVFALYLYLAGNVNDHEKWLSPKDFENVTGKSRSSYYRAIEKLKELGYIYESSSGILNFATVPKVGLRTATQNWEQSDSTMENTIVKEETMKSHEWDTTYPQMNIEIDNRENRNNREIERSFSKASTRDSLEYLYSEVNEYGFHDGVYFDDEITAFWFKPPERMPEFIASKTRFSEDEAKFIVDNILDTSITTKIKRMELTGD